MYMYIYIITKIPAQMRILLAINYEQKTTKQLPNNKSS